MQLHREGLGRIKMALVGTNTSLLLEILEGSFGHVDLDTTRSFVSTDITEVPVTKPTATEKPSGKPLEEKSEKTSVPTSKDNSLVSAELVFPQKSIPLVITRLPEPFLSLHGPETLSCYRCQYPSCNHKFSQKAAACNHVHHDHLNIALACLYYSFNDNPKMHWYSASTWEHHTCKHAQNNLPIYSDDPTFFQQFTKPESIPSTSTVTPELPNIDIIHKQAIAAKQFLEEESDKSTFPLLKEHEPSPPEAPKWYIKQGPVKSSQKQKESKIKDDDE